MFGNEKRLEGMRQMVKVLGRPDSAKRFTEFKMTLDKENKN
jgi:hypothetical protein